MSEHPILFSGPMAQAILDGKKTQTRRVIKDDWWRCLDPEDPDDLASAIPQCPYGVAGDRLWVREAAYIAPPNFGRDASDCNVVDNDGRPRVVGWAASMDSDGVRVATEFGVKLTPSIHMPRWASRITLEILSVGVERLQDISMRDVIAEGIHYRAVCASEGRALPSDYIATFAKLWNSINAKRGFGWDANPWVWVVEFKVVQ